MHFAREPLDRIVFAPDRPREVVIPDLVLQSLREMRDAVLGDDQFACQIDQRVDLHLIHAQGTARGALRLLRPGRP